MGNTLGLDTNVDNTATSTVPITSVSSPEASTSTSTPARKSVPTSAIPTTSVSTSEASTSTTSAGQSSPTEVAKKTIFLSHEGKDKTFATFLFRELQRRDQNPFLDVDRESLPKGERFPDNIVEAVRGCQLVVFVLSESFVTKKWPMIELVEAYLHYQKKKRPLLFPLFYSLSVDKIDEKKNPSMWNEWTKAWDQMVKDPTTNESMTIICGEALKAITKHNGMSRGTQNEHEFMMKVADEICRIVKPDIWGINDMQHHDVLSQVVKKEFDEQPAIGPKVLGMWGEKDSGKSKLSNALCSDYYNQYNGCVECVELTSRSQTSILKEVKIILQSLTDADWRLLDSITSLPIAINHLQNRIRGKEFFMAIDDVSKDMACKRDLIELLVGITKSCNKDSRVLLTARDDKVLRSLFSECGFRTEPIRVPPLEEQGAIDILVSFATNSKQSWNNFNEEEKHAIQRLCGSPPIFNASSGSFSPGKAKSIGLLISGSKKEIAEAPVEWQSVLEKYQSSALQSELFSETTHRVLESAFKDNAKVQQALLFIVDATLYDKAMGHTLKGIWRWFGIVHDISQKSVIKMFEEFKRLQLIDWDEEEREEDLEHPDDGTVFEWPHFMFLKFAQMEARTNVSKWRWFYYDGHKPEEVPQNMEVDKVKKMALVRGDFSDVVEVVNLSRCVRVVAFMMARCGNVQHVKVRAMRELQVLEIESCNDLEKIKGLEEDKVLLERLYLNRVPNWVPASGVLNLGHFKNLRNVRLINTGMQKPPVVNGCRDLRELYIEANSKLEKLPVLWTDLSYLTDISFADNPRITFLPNLSPLAPSLSSLSVRNCAALTNILTIESLTSLESLNISLCGSLDSPLPDLSKLKQNRLKQISAYGLTDKTLGIWRNKGPDA